MSTLRPSLEAYRSKRDFRATPEPRGRERRSDGNLYVVQKHAARRLHFDLRLELDGVLKSWAVTKGPSLDPSDKRLAVRTEDHPVEYGGFEGVIPDGYGAGTVMLWDRGTWTPRDEPHAGLARGALKFSLAGERLRGGFALIRMKSKRGERESWLLVKERDEFAEEEVDPIERWEHSVESGRRIEDIAREVSAGRDTRRRAGGKAVRPRARDRPRRRRAANLEFVPPQLPTLREEPPDGPGWLHELKHDGYRIQALIEDGTARLLTRGGKDWTRRYPRIARALAAVDAGSAIIDGELVALDESGRSAFASLQNAAGEQRVALAYQAFDLLHLDGQALGRRPLRERKALLKRLLDDAGAPLHYSDHVEGHGRRVLAHACAMKLEGIVSKRADAPYRPGRGTTWVKSKCAGNDEFVIGGYRSSAQPGRPFSSLLLGELSGGRLLYRGRVGTGFDAASLRGLEARMRPLRRAASPFHETPVAARNRARWLEPKLVAQVGYTERTRDGLLRHPTFLGLREDKQAKDVTARTSQAGGEAVRLEGVRLTSPDKVMFPEQGATKRAVAEYYARHAERILPFVAGRPLSLLRCPSGRGGQCFFQKHHDASMPEGLETVEIAEKDGKLRPYLVANSARALVAAAQIGALELHPWGARADRVEHPERLVFDLDPGPGLDFALVRAAALEVRDVLADAGLRSFVLLTGGKGVHVIVPLQRRREWKEVKAVARGLATQLARAYPKRYVARATKRERVGRIFIDWLRNERGATAIAPYSLRARAGAPVATPIGWRELARIGAADAYTLANIDRRLKRRAADPWPEYHTLRQSITKAHLERFR